jgi:heterodisulfide reductase subunit A
VGNDLLPEEVIQQFSNRLVPRELQDKNFGDVMVVGGGVSGIQASLDLAAAGFKVYLVEKGPSIGGHMAQLDKTFPTNDCSM